VSQHDYDLIVIGGGPAGTCGANTAAVLGHRVALVEREREIGGAGINSGTLPSKTLRETALALSGWRSRRLFGVDLSLRREATIGDLTYHKEAVCKAERQYLESRLHTHHVERVEGTASFVDEHSIRIARHDGSQIQMSAAKFLIATGSSPWRPPEFEFSDDRVHDSDELLHLKELPKKLVVVGAGVIGSEYACTFAAMDVETHLVDSRNMLLPFLDDEISRALADAMIANGVHFHWNEKVIHCDVSHPQEVVLTLSSGAKFSVDGLLVCAGRSSNTAALDLPAAGITPGPRGIINVDAHYCTSVPHIYAAGDVIGPPALASTGMEQARVAMCYAFGVLSKGEMAHLLPTGIYTIPEVSMVGETEEGLQEKGIDYVVGRAYYSEIPRGRIVGDETGFLKLIFRRDDMRLLGAHVIGEHATEVIHIGLIAMLAETGAEVFNRACFNYPTLGELYKHATYDALLRGGLLHSIFQ